MCWVDIYLDIIWNKNQNVTKSFLLFKEIDYIIAVSNTLYSAGPQALWIQVKQNRQSCEELWNMLAWSQGD